MPRPIPICLDLDQLRSHLAYDSETGELRWKAKRRGIRPGSLAGTPHPAGYRQIRIDKRHYFAHRLAWYLHTGQDPGELQIDHINGDRGDNRFINLRLATLSQNQRNSRTPANNSSGVKGVTWNKRKGKWQAQIAVLGKYHHLGLFATVDAAAEARMEAERKYHGDFARHEATTN